LHSDIHTYYRLGILPKCERVIRFAIAFGVLVVLHSLQMIIYRKLYSLVIITSAVLQVLAFVFRILSMKNPTSIPFFTLWFVLILVAPIWTNAYVYMIMGRMVYNFHPRQRLAKLQARRFGLVFVLLDIFAFLVQAGAASMAAGQNVPLSQINNGIHIYMGGIGFQQLFIFIFLGLAIKFQRDISQSLASDDKSRALRLLYVMYGALVLITIRIIFRLIEWSHGVNSSIPNHEVFMFIFDSLPMWIAIFLFNIVHPGKIMPGKESDLPSRKEYRRLKKANKEAMVRSGGIPLEFTYAEGVKKHSAV